ncbi:MAG: hypothetical protein ABIW38_04230 [Ferruginibacter sp.]
MKNYLSLVIVSVSMLFLLSFTKTTNLCLKNNAGVYKKMSHDVPFKADYSTVVRVLHGPPLLQQEITGTGKATHMGQSSFTALSTVNLTTAPPFQVTGTAIFRSANGDEFYTEFAGTSTPVGNGTSHVVLTHTLTGGTGRFDNASGSFMGSTIANPQNPVGSISYLGYINY